MVVSSPAIGFLAALMRKASVNLCNEAAGVMRMARGHGARCVAIFGPTDPARWKPVDEPFWACVPVMS